MSTVIVDAATASQLDKQSGEMELRTSGGRFLGFFSPVRDGTPEDYEWARQHFTKEELDAARNEPGGYTTAEVLAYLKSLDQQA